MFLVVKTERLRRRRGNAMRQWLLAFILINIPISILHPIHLSGQTVPGAPTLVVDSTSFNTASLTITPGTGTTTHMGIWSKLAADTFLTVPNEYQGAKDANDRYTIGALAPNTAYDFKAQGINGGGPGGVSNIVRASTLGPPDLPTMTVAMGLTTAVATVIPAATGVSASSVALYVTKSGDTFAPGPPSIFFSSLSSDNTYPITVSGVIPDGTVPLEHSTTYEFRAQTANQAGPNTDYTVAISKATWTPPGDVQNPVAWYTSCPTQSVQSSTIRFEWEAPTSFGLKDGTAGTSAKYEFKAITTTSPPYTVTEVHAGAPATALGATSHTISGISGIAVAKSVAARTDESGL